MAIKYRSILKGEPGVPGGGVKKYYASLVLGDEVSVDELVKEIEKFCTVTEPDIVAVIAAMEYVVETQLCNSRHVRFNRLGTIYPRLSSKGVDTEEEVVDSLIYRKGLRYHAGKKLKDALKMATLQKVDILHL